ncbi:MAG: hypothetical protein R2795_04170 [Saprospiraceae bacterium]
MQLIAQHLFSFCTDTATVTVLVDTLPPAVIIGIPGTLDCNHPTVILDGSTSLVQDIQVAWSSMYRK